MFKSWFSKPAQTPEVPEATADLSLGALLVRMAKVDSVYDAAEIATVDRVLAAQYDLSVVEAAKMRATCEVLEKMGPDTDRFVALIQDNIPPAQRAALMAALVDVAKADGLKHPQEMSLIQKLGPVLDPQGEQDPS